MAKFKKTEYEVPLGLQTWSSISAEKTNCQSSLILPSGIACCCPGEGSINHFLHVLLIGCLGINIENNSAESNV